MSSGATKQWGTTPPISEALPTKEELALNDALIAELKRQNNFESAEETERRKEVLKTLAKVTTAFVRHVGTIMGLSQAVLNDAGGKIFTYGSYRLGVFGPGSDIDTLVVAPKHVSRDDFFKHFPPLLEKMSPAGAIEELTAVKDSFVPIIKLEYSGISIDLIFARLQVASVPTNLDLKENSLLQGLDDTELRCVNGTRVTDEILTLVPQVKTFRLALRVIKLWANRRAIYSNVMGFPGGVAWAMMVARICQLYPRAAASAVVGKFFNLMGTWPWPRPILLKNIEDGPGRLRIWNPQIYPGDKRHLMPIITPAYPSMCATHNITLSTQKIITQELKRGGELMVRIYNGSAQWKDLFEKNTFFTKDYKYYLSIIAASKTKEAQAAWSGTVESKVRRLVTAIELSQSGVELVHPFIKGFERIHHCQNEEEVDKVLQGSLQFQAKDTKTETTDENNDATRAAAAEGNLDIKMAATDEENGVDDKKLNGADFVPVYTTTYYIGIELAKDSKSLDISFAVQEFKRLCVESSQYDKEKNSLRTVHTRNYDLPDDLFEPGEERPTKAKKTKAAKPNGELGLKKRSFADSFTESNTDNDPKRRRGSSSLPQG